MRRGCGTDRGAKTKRKSADRRAKAASALPDFDSNLDALLMSFTRMLSDDGSDEALDLAQEKAFEAVAVPLAGERTALAREELGLSQLCADAYLVLA